MFKDLKENKRKRNGTYFLKDWMEFMKLKNIISQMKILLDG